jgi:hypothetical protein
MNCNGGRIKMTKERIYTARAAAVLSGILTLGSFGVAGKNYSDMCEITRDSELLQVFDEVDKDVRTYSKVPHIYSVVKKKYDELSQNTELMEIKRTRDKKKQHAMEWGLIGGAGLGVSLLGLAMSLNSRRKEDEIIEIGRVK